MSNKEVTFEHTQKWNQAISSRIEIILEEINRFKFRCGLVVAAAVPVKILGYMTFAALPLHTGVPKAMVLVGKISLASYIGAGIIEGVVALENKKQFKKFEPEIRAIDDLKWFYNYQLDQSKVEGVKLKETLLKPIPSHEEKSERGLCLEKLWIGGMTIAAPLTRLVGGKAFFTRELVKKFIGVFGMGEIVLLLGRWVDKHPANKVGRGIMQQLESERKLCERIHNELNKVKEII